MATIHETGLVRITGTDGKTHIFDAADINFQTDAAVVTPYVSKIWRYNTPYGSYMHTFPVPEKTQRRRTRKQAQARKLYGLPDV